MHQFNNQKIKPIRIKEKGTSTTPKRFTNVGDPIPAKTYNICNQNKNIQLVTQFDYYYYKDSIN